MKQRSDAAALDDNDPLRALRSAFQLPDGVLYLDGNSLGPPPKRALSALDRAAKSEWRDGLIRSWNDAGWFDLPKRSGAKLSKIIGAGKDEVLVTDSVSANLFKLAAALTPKGGTIAVDLEEFPTDQYILEGLSQLTGAALLKLERGAETPDNVSVLIRSLVCYKTAAVADMAAMEKQAAEKDARIIWDLSHTAGLLDVDLNRDGAKFAIGCGYKFLNGGPGAPAFIYVARSEADKLSQPLSGWMGHAAPFDFSPDFAPAPGVARFACGTPPILSMTALDAALDLFDGVDMKEVEKKSRALGDLFLDLTRPLGLETVSPPAGARRGGHVSLRHEHGYAVMQALITRGVIGDFRAPDLIRFGFSPLFLRYADIWDAAAVLKDILDTDEWRAPKFSERAAVT